MRSRLRVGGGCGLRFVTNIQVNHGEPLFNVQLSEVRDEIEQQLCIALSKSSHFFGSHSFFTPSRYSDSIFLEFCWEALSGEIYS